MNRAAKRKLIAQQAKEKLLQYRKAESEFLAKDHRVPTLAQVYKQCKAEFLRTSEPEPPAIFVEPSEPAASTPFLTVKQRAERREKELDAYKAAFLLQVERTLDRYRLASSVQLSLHDLARTTSDSLDLEEGPSYEQLIAWIGEKYGDELGYKLEVHPLSDYVTLSYAASE